MNEIQVFQNENFSVRTICENDELWFVAKDIAEALDYAEWRTTLMQSVPDIWKGTKRICTPGGKQEMLCLTEQGLYFFLGRSDKPKALPYQMWIAGEVVPSIRKTGTYSAHHILLNDVLDGAKIIFETAGIKDNQLSLAMDNVFKSYTGRSALAMGNIQLKAPVQEQTLSPTQIGELIGGLNARRVNEALAGMGYQHKIAGKWEPLELGKPYAVMLDVGKRHSDGAPIRCLRWNSSVIKEIKNYVK